MKKLNEILFITEDTETGKWYVDFLRPQFQGGESVEISKQEAISLLKVITSTDIHIGDLPHNPNDIR